MGAVDRLLDGAERGSEHRDAAAAGPLAQECAGQTTKGEGGEYRGKQDDREETTSEEIGRDQAI